MYEKILEKLKLQRGQNLQVSDKTLEKMAKRFSKYIDTEEKLKEEDFTEDIENLQGNIGHIAKQVKEDTEKNFKKVEKTPAEIETERLAKIEKEKEDEKKGISPEVSALMEQNKQIMETLSSMNGEKIATTRSEKLGVILKDAMPEYKNQILSGFKHMNFENDEAFNSYFESTKTNFAAFEQKDKEQGLNTAIPNPDVKQPEKEELNPTFAKAMAAHDEQKALDKEKE